VVEIKSRAPLRAPLKVCLWLTDTCNLACKYCYAAPFSGKYMDKMRFLELIEEFRRLNVFQLTLAGGEPFMHPDIVEILNACAASGMWFGLITNGTFLDDAMLERVGPLLKDRKRFLLQISLDSSDPSCNDFTRGRGKLVLENINRTLKYGVPLQIGCVLTRSNISTAHELIDKFYPMVKNYHFMNLQPTKYSLKHPDLFPGKEETHNFWSLLKDYVNLHSDLNIPSLKTYWGAYEADRLETPISSFDPVYCSVAFTTAEINAKFDVFGCDIAKEYSFIGNVASKAFEEVWNSELAAQVRLVNAPLCSMREGACRTSSVR